MNYTTGMIDEPHTGLLNSFNISSHELSLHIRVLEDPWRPFPADSGRCNRRPMPFSSTEDPDESWTPNPEYGRRRNIQSPHGASSASRALGRSCALASGSASAKQYPRLLPITSPFHLPLEALSESSTQPGLCAQMQILHITRMT